MSIFQGTIAKRLLLCLLLQDQFVTGVDRSSMMDSSPYNHAGGQLEVTPYDVSLRDAAPTRASHSRQWKGCVTKAVVSRSKQAEIGTNRLLYRSQYISEVNVLRRSHMAWFASIIA